MSDEMPTFDVRTVLTREAVEQFLTPFIEILTIALNVLLWHKAGAELRELIRVVIKEMRSLCPKGAGQYNRESWQASELLFRRFSARMGQDKNLMLAAGYSMTQIRSTQEPGRIALACGEVASIIQSAMTPNKLERDVRVTAVDACDVITIAVQSWTAERLPGPKQKQRQDEILKRLEKVRRHLETASSNWGMH